jgi:hypothetical protein
MSEFLARLAARAVGQAAVAQPRLPSLFESGPGSQATPDSFDVVDEEVATGRPSVAPREASSASAAQSARDAASEAGSPAASSTVPVRATRDGSAQRSESVVFRQRQDASDHPVRKRPGAVVGGDPAPDGQLGDAPFESDPDPRTLLTVPAVPLTPAAPLTTWPENESLRSVTPGSSEPPAVRVHIGRLEIRANLPEPASPRPRTPPREDAAKGVSLADYLRGTR